MTIATEKRIFSQSPSRQEYEAASKPSRQEYEKSLAPQRPQVRPRTYSSDISGPFDVWAAPSDSEIWKSPGADFVAGFGAGWVKQTQVPALMGKKLPPPTTRAEKIGEGAGRAMEVITEFIGLGAILRSVGLMSKVIPKGAWAGRALQTGFLFGTQQATEEARKATAEAVYGEDFGSRGGIAILESFTFGAILSLATSGGGRVARAIWSKLKPSEQTMLLRELGLEKGATLQEINKAAKQVAAKSHFDFGRKGMNPAQIKAVETKFKQNWQRMTYIRNRLKILRSGDIIKASSKQNFKKQLMGKTGVSSEVADVAIKRLDAGESITKVDQMISQAKAGIKPLITAPPKDIVIPPTVPIVAPEPTPTGQALVKAPMGYIKAVKNAKGKYEIKMGREAPDNPFTNETFTGEFDTPQIARKSYEAWFMKQQEPVAGRKAEIAPVAKPKGKVADMTLDELKKESAIFDKKIETEIARLDKIAPKRQRFAETGIEHLSQEDASRMVTINDEIGRRTGMSQAEAKKRVAEKRAARKAIAPVTQLKAVEVEKAIADNLGIEVKTEPTDPANKYEVALGQMSTFTEGDNKLEVWIKETPDQFVLSQIKVEKEGTGLATKFINQLKDYADKTGKKFIMPAPTPTARKFLDKFKWLKVGALRIDGVVETTLEYKPPTVAKPEAVEGKIADVEFIKDRWDSSKLGYRVELVMRGKWITKKGQITKSGEKYAESKWDELSPAVQNVVRKFIAKDYNRQLPITKPKGKPGFIDVRPLLKVHKTFMGIVEPSKAVELKLGKEPYATVIKGVHQVDVGRIEFNEAQIEGQDKSLSQMSQWFSRFSDKDLKNFMISRGTPRSEEAQRIQYEARGKLPKELQRSDLFQVAQRIADSNYKYLQSVVGDDIHRVEDYFYGIWKNPKKVDKLLDYWHTTKRFTKEKKLPTVADAMDYDSTMELRSWNPIENLKAEYIAISHLEGMNWMKDELLRTGKGKYIDEMLEAPMDWDIVHDPVFKDLRLQPDLAKLINNLIATNKISQIPLLNTLREINNVARTIKFVGSAFHLLSVAKQSVADSGYLGFLYKPTALKGFTRGFRANDPIFKTTAYKDYIRHGGGHRYSVESEARRAFTGAVNELSRNMGIAVRVGALPLKIPVSFVNWMFQSYIPKVKYSKFLDVMAEKEKKFNRKLTSPEKIDIIKEQQNFYGMMNERLFGRSGTVTSALRFYFMSPGYAEGNYRTMLKAATQWGGKTGANANRSRSNIINSWLITGTLATVGTLIFTGKPPKKPESLEDARDLFKIDTGKLDERGRRIMIDMMTYDKDYWNVAFNILRLRPDVALGESWRRIGGMKAPTAEMIVDLALMSMGKAIYDWKGDRVVEITDPFLLKAMKLTVFEIKKLSPISVSVFQQSKKRDIDTTIAAIETLLGFRPTKTEKDIREQKITSKMYSLAGQKEELSYYIGESTDPKESVRVYNKTVNDILNSPYTPKAMKDKWSPRLLIEYDKVVTWKRFPAGKMTNAELNRAYDAHTLSVPYKRRGEPFRMIGEPRKGSERRVTELKAEAQKRGIVLKRGPRKPPRR